MVLFVVLYRVSGAVFVSGTVTSVEVELLSYVLPGGPKKRGHSTFSQISRKLLKISK